MPNFDASFLANLDRVEKGKTSSKNSSSISSAPQQISGNFPSAFLENLQRVETQPRPKAVAPTQISQPTPPQQIQQPNMFQQAGGLFSGALKSAQSFVDNEIKHLQGVKVTLTAPKPQMPQQQPQTNASIVQKQQPQDVSKLPQTYLSQGKAPSVWDKIVQVFNNFTGNSVDDQKARDMNAYAVQKVDGEKLYQKRIQAEAQKQNIDSKALDQAIQTAAKEQGKSKFDMVGLGLTDLAAQGGNPFRNSVMEDVSKELGIRTIPTNKEVTDLLMTAAAGFGLAEAPVATIKALGLFSGVNAIKSGIVSTLKGEGFQPLSGEGIGDLAPKGTPMPVQTALDFLDFLGTSAVVGGLYKVSPQIGERLTKDVITKYHVPETVHFSPEQVQRVVKGEELGKVRNDLAKAGLSSSEWRNAAQKGIQITLPTEKIVALVDKPYWKAFKGVLGMEEAAPRLKTIHQGQEITNIAGYLPSGEYTPQEVLGKIVNTPLADTPEGKALIKTAIHAQENNTNMQIEVPDTNSIRTQATLDKEAAQQHVRLKDTYNSALEQQSTQELHNDPLKFRDQYIEKYGNVVNPDLSRKLIPDYNGINANEVNNFGVGVKNIVLNHLLDTGKQRTDSNNTVMWTGGSPGSGKSTTLDTISPEKKKGYVAIVDTTFSPNSTVRDIAKVLKRGYNVEVRFTISDPLEAWKRVISRAVSETDTSGKPNPDFQRVVSEEYFVKAIGESIKNAIEAYNKFGTKDNFKISFFKNFGGKQDITQTNIDFLRNYKYNEEQLRRQIHEYTDELKKEGKISEELYKEFTSDRRSGVATSNEAKQGISASETSKQQVTSTKKVLTGNEVKAVRTVIESKLEKIRTTANSAEAYATELDKLISFVEEKAGQDKKVLSALRTELNKEMFGIAGVGGNYKEAFAQLQTVKQDPEMAKIIDTFESVIEKLDNKLLQGNSGQGGAFAATGSAPLGKFENQNGKGNPTDFKLFERTKELVKKYAQRISEHGMPSRNAIGLYHVESKNIRTHGINDFSTNVHEIAHAIDHSFDGLISMQIAKKTGETTDGKPKYDKATRSLRVEMTQLYSKYYPTGNAKNAVKIRMVEGYATLLQKYIEMPSTISAEFPNLYREFLTPEGKYYKPIVGEFINDAQNIVTEYQGLSALDKVGARVVNKTMETDKSFLNVFEKVRTFMEDELYPVEKVGKLAGTQWSGDDPSLWLRQYSRGGGIYANNILNPHTGYWSMDSQGEFVKKFSFNWKTIMDRLQKEKVVDEFGYYLVARDQNFQWKELDRLKANYEKVRSVLDLGEQLGIKVSDIKNNPQIAEDMGIDIKELEGIIQSAQDAKRKYKEQKKYLENNGFTREEVESAYTGNQSRFSEIETQYDALVREDLNLLHNPLIGIVTPETYSQLNAKEGYASMKRAFYDDIQGDSLASFQGAGGKLAPKISSLKKRTGGQHQIINPVLSGMVNHIEIVKKSLKQIVYNKVGQIGIKGTVPDLFQREQLRSFRDDTGKIVFPQEKDENVIMARIGYKRVPILTDKLVKATIDNTLSYQSMNLFEHLLVTAGRVFTIGTTGAYAPFALVNFPADQWNAVLNTRNNYTPLMDTVKILRNVILKRGGKYARYWNEWEIMGGDKMTLFQAQMQDTTVATKYITQERNGLEKALNLVNTGVDIGAAPAKYSETISRFTEYVKAREAGKPQVVALEEAGRITAPFHHIGSWKVGNFNSMKFVVKSVPFANAALQVVAQAARTAETPKGRKRLFWVMTAMTTAYLASMYAVSQYGSKDQKEQYKGLGTNDIGQYLFFPNISGNGLSRVRVSQELSTIGTIMNMILAQNLLGAKFTAEDYKDALTEWMPRQFNALNPVEMFFSWFNPIIKIPVEVLANFKDYPRISPLENQSMQNLAPKDRYNEYTSSLAKTIGNTFNISPLKVDYLINGLFGRASGFITGKPNIYNPTSQVNREYLFTLDKRVDQFYQNRATFDQQYASLREKWKNQPTVPEDVLNQVTVLKQKRQAYDFAADLIKYYRDIPDTNKEAQKKARAKIIPVLERLPAP